jgi:hypothetical protein
MRASPRFSRRSFLATVPALSMALAGCGGCNGGGLSKRKYDKIELGTTTEKDVLDLLGTPKEAIPEGSGITERGSAIWKDGDRIIVVFFKDGKAVHKTSRGL